MLVVHQSQNLLLVPNLASDGSSVPFQLDCFQHLAPHMLPSQAGAANTKEVHKDHETLGHSPGSKTDWGWAHLVVTTSL